MPRHLRAVPEHHLAEHARRRRAEILRNVPIGHNSAGWYPFHHIEHPLGKGVPVHAVSISCSHGRDHLSWNRTEPLGTGSVESTSIQTHTASEYHGGTTASWCLSYRAPAPP